MSQQPPFQQWNNEHQDPLVGDPVVCDQCCYIDSNGIRCQKVNRQTIRLRRGKMAAKSVLCPDHKFNGKRRCLYCKNLYSRSKKLRRPTFFQPFVWATILLDDSCSLLHHLCTACRSKTFGELKNDIIHALQISLQQTDELLMRVNPIKFNEFYCMSCSLYFIGLQGMPPYCKPCQGTQRQCANCLMLFPTTTEQEYCPFCLEKSRKQEYTDEE